MSDYDADILDWSEHQATLLRRIAAGERINNQVDWENVIDEIESVGRSQLHAVRSHLVQAILHDLKALAWPNARDVEHWRSEAIRHRQDALDAFAPSMRQHIDLATLYRRALRALPATVDGQPPQPVPQTAQNTLDELLREP